MRPRVSGTLHIEGHQPGVMRTISSVGPRVGGKVHARYGLSVVTWTGRDLRVEQVIRDPSRFYDELVSGLEWLRDEQGLS